MFVFEKIYELGLQEPFAFSGGCNFFFDGVPDRRSGVPAYPALIFFFERGRVAIIESSPFRPVVSRRKKIAPQPEVSPTGADSCRRTLLEMGRDKRVPGRSEVRSAKSCCTCAFLPVEK